MKKENFELAKGEWITTRRASYDNAEEGRYIAQKCEGCGYEFEEGERVYNGYCDDCQKQFLLKENCVNFENALKYAKANDLHDCTNDKKWGKHECVKNLISWLMDEDEALEILIDALRKEKAIFGERHQKDLEDFCFDEFVEFNEFCCNEL